MVIKTTSSSSCFNTKMDFKEYDLGTESSSKMLRNIQVGYRNLNLDLFCLIFWHLVNIHTYIDTTYHYLTSKPMQLYLILYRVFYVDKKKSTFD